jgi:hypothetical protein
MPKLLPARAPLDDKEERQVRKLAGSRHAPGDWIRHAGMIARSWDGLCTSAIAAELGCHPESVRERPAHLNAEGLDGLGNRPGAGRKPQLTKGERRLVRLYTFGEVDEAVLRSELADLKQRKILEDRLLEIRPSVSPHAQHCQTPV